MAAATPWVARIDQIADDGAGGLIIQGSFWDATDTGFTTKFGGFNFVVDGSWSQAMVVEKIQSIGAIIRTARVASQNLQGRIGTTIQVP